MHTLAFLLYRHSQNTLLASWSILSKLVLFHHISHNNFNIARLNTNSLALWMTNSATCAWWNLSIIFLKPISFSPLSSSYFILYYSHILCFVFFFSNTYVRFYYYVLYLCIYVIYSIRIVCRSKLGALMRIYTNNFLLLSWYLVPSFASSHYITIINSLFILYVWLYYSFRCFYF